MREAGEAERGLRLGCPGLGRLQSLGPPWVVCTASPSPDSRIFTWQNNNNSDVSSNPQRCWNTQPHCGQALNTGVALGTCTQLDARGEDWPRRAPTPSQGAELSHRPGGPPGPSNTKPQAPRPLQRLPCLRHWAPAPQGRAWPLPRHAVLRTPGSVCWTVFGRTLETRGLCPKVQLRGCQGRGGFWFSSWIPVTARDGQAHRSPGQQ